MTEGKLICWIKLRDFCKKVYVQLGFQEEDAFLVADSLLQADLRGVRSHGIERMNVYIKRVELGLFNLSGEIKVIEEGPSTILVDGCNNMGPIACCKAIRLGLAKARESGSASICVRNSNHFGAAAYYTNIIAEQEYLGFTCTGAPPDVAPWGSYVQYLGTNPFSVAVPTSDGTMVLDMATSIQAKGKVRLALARNEKLPEGWCLDKHGNPTTDPAAALEGTMLPVGGPKGYSMAVFVDILGGVLSGAAFGKYGPHFARDFTQPCNVGHFFFILDIERFMPLGQFKKRLDVMISDIKALPKREGVDEIFLPGEIETNKLKKAKQEGIFVDGVQLQFLAAMADKFRIPMDF